MRVLKLVLTSIKNYSIVLFAWIFYTGDAPLNWSTFILIQLLFICLNYKIANNRINLVFLNINLLISTIVANVLLTNLLYNNISSDSETLAVGNFGLMVGIVFVLILSLIFVILKRKNSNKRKNTTETPVVSDGIF